MSQNEESNPGTLPASTGTNLPVDVHPAVAPRWHTFVLIVALLLFSWLGAKGALKGEQPPNSNDHSAQSSGAHASKGITANSTKDAVNSTAMSSNSRMLTYGTTLIFELILLGWVWLGMRLQQIPFQVLLGDRSYGWLRNIAIAALFWILALIVLSSCGIGWLVAEKEIHSFGHPEHHSSLFGTKENSDAYADKKSPLPDEKSSTEKPPQTVLRLAPTNVIECLFWLLLSVTAGFCEEIIFRGYLQRQLSNIFGKAAIGAGLSAICFGLSHGYEGARTMFLITIFGALFSVLALRMRSLKPGMIAHAWHDLLTGYTIAALKAAGVF